MSFNVSWVYKAIDKFTPVAKKITNATKKITAAARTLETRMKATTKSFTGASSKLGSLSGKVKIFGEQLRRSAGSASLFNRNLRSTGTALTATSGAMTVAQNSARRFRTTIRSSGDAIENLQSKMMAFVAIAATAFVISFPLRHAIKFEEAMADVNKVMDFARPDGLRLMSLDILDLSRRIPIAATGLAEIAAAGGQFGIAEKNVIKFTETVAKMSTAFDLMPRETGEAVAKLSNIFDIEVDRFEDFADRINFVSNNVAASANEIIRSLQNKGAAAGRIMNLSAEDTLGLAATFIQLGTRADRVGSIMDSMSRRLSDVSILGEDFVAKFTAAPQETLIGLLRIINKMPAGAKKAQVLTTIFGEFSSRVGLLAETMDKKLIPTLALANDAIGAAGSVTEEFTKRSATAAAKLDKTKNSVVGVSTKLGNALLPALKPVVDFIGLFADGMGWLIARTGPLVPMLFSAAFALLAVAAATKAWAVIQAVLNVALTANPIGLIIISLAALGAAIVWLIDKFGGFLNLVKHLGNTLMLSLLLPILLVAKAFDALFDTNIQDAIKDFSKQVTFDIAGGLEPVNMDSRAQMDININAPAGVIESVETKTEGPTRLNVGQNLVPAGAG